MRESEEREEVGRPPATARACPCPLSFSPPSASAAAAPSRMAFSRLRRSSAASPSIPCACFTPKRRRRRLALFSSFFLSVVCLAKRSSQHLFFHPHCPLPSSSHHGAAPRHPSGRAGPAAQADSRGCVACVGGWGCPHSARAPVPKKKRGGSGEGFEGKPAGDSKCS